MSRRRRRFADTLSGGITGATAGGTIGAAGGPWGAVIGAGVGGIAGAVGGNLASRADESFTEADLAMSRTQQALGEEQLKSLKSSRIEEERKRRLRSAFAQRFGTAVSAAMKSGRGQGFEQVMAGGI